MNQLDRLYQLERLLLSRNAFGRDALLEKLEISRATLKRYLELLRDRMNVPVVYDRYSVGANAEITQAADFRLPTSSVGNPLSVTTPPPLGGGRQNPQPG